MGMCLDEQMLDFQQGLCSIHTYIHSFIPWTHEFVMATTGCGISHKDTKYIDKCSKNKLMTPQKNTLQNIVKITQKRLT
jgi:hypothetical protein